MEDFYEYAEEETARADGNQCDNDLPRLAEDTTATTGYEASTTGTVTTSGSAAAPADDDKKTAVNAVVTSPNDESKEEAIQAAKSGLTGYETEEELASIAAGKSPKLSSRKQKKQLVRPKKPGIPNPSIRHRRFPVKKWLT